MVCSERESEREFALIDTLKITSRYYRVITARFLECLIVSNSEKNKMRFVQRERELALIDTLKITSHNDHFYAF